MLLNKFKNKINTEKMRGPGIEPGSTAWKAAMLTITPATLITNKTVKYLFDSHPRSKYSFRTTRNMAMYDNI